MNSMRSSVPRWLDWVVRNSKPKPDYSAPPKPEPTRWQQPGPKSREQWINFYKWIANSAAPKRTATRTEAPAIFIAVAAAPKLADMQLPSAAERLSQPRMPRGKYIAPVKPPHPFRPQINRHIIPRPERSRPAKQPVVPCCFQHVDIEAEFWKTIRFPVSKAARSYKPTAKLIELAQPRSYPPKPHCPLPPAADLSPPKRSKMTREQWRNHLCRLHYLALPSQRVLAELPRQPMFMDCMCS
ncbi:CG31245, partial [Drosophila busckii]